MKLKSMTTYVITGINALALIAVAIIIVCAISEFNKILQLI